MDFTSNGILGKVGGEFIARATSALPQPGSELVEDVVCVYGNANAFRIAPELITTHHKDMTYIELGVRCLASRERFSAAAERSQPLLAALRDRATERFRVGFGRR